MTNGNDDEDDPYREVSALAELDQLDDNQRNRVLRRVLIRFALLIRGLREFRDAHEADSVEREQMAARITALERAEELRRERATALAEGEQKGVAKAQHSGVVDLFMSLAKKGLEYILIALLAAVLSFVLLKKGGGP